MDGYVRELDLVDDVFGEQFRFYPLTRSDIARIDSYRRRAAAETAAQQEHKRRCRRGKITNWVRGPWVKAEKKRELAEGQR